MKAYQFLAASFLVLTGATTARAESLTLTTNEISLIPYGSSVSAAINVPPLGFSPNHVSASLIGNGCVGAITGANVANATGLWEAAQLASDGSWSFSTVQPTELQFAVTQTTYLQEQCQYQVTLSSDGGISPTPTGSWTLLGAVSFSGGFQQRLPLVLATPSLVKTVRIDIPAFCAGDQILEVGTLIDGVYTAATATDASGSFAVNNGNGLIISEILVSVNGPTAQTCALPVYVQ